jgi:hypothetical protein
MPILTVEGIQAVERYIEDNYDAVVKQDRRIRDGLLLASSLLRSKRPSGRNGSSAWKPPGD